jgi:tripartite-type tricarboxylate transporter receptor subunit TctC
MCDAIRQVLAAPATEQAASAQGAVHAYGTPEQLTQAMTRDAELFGRVIREQGIQAG